MLAALAATAATGVWAGTAHASGEGDAERGREFAAKWCANCHEISPGQPAARPDVEAPAFATIARDKTADLEAFRETLTLTHTLMPIPRLEDQTREDVLAYFLSLR